MLAEGIWEVVRTLQLPEIEAYPGGSLVIRIDILRLADAEDVLSFLVWKKSCEVLYPDGKVDRLMKEQLTALGDDGSSVSTILLLDERLTPGPIFVRCRDAHGFSQAVVDYVFRSFSQSKEVPDILRLADQ